MSTTTYIRSASTVVRRSEGKRGVRETVSRAYAVYRFTSAAAGFVSTIPQIAPAARVRISREIRFSPATSTMLGNMTMSLVPT